MLSLCPRAGEGGGCFVSAKPRKAQGVRGPAADPERARTEAARRARAKLRRYCAANGLNRLGTLTYAKGCHDPRQARRDAGVFFRALRMELGGEPRPYAWVPEWHKTHGLHLHFAVGRYVPRRLIEGAWSRVEDHGWVHIKLLGDLPVGSGKLAEARAAAGYLSKYVSKSFTDDEPGKERPRGLHRFDVAQGFTPATTRLWGATADNVIWQASRLMGGPPESRWSSDEVEGWQAPPAVWVQWAG